MYPKVLESLIENLMKLPGVGYKSAQRYAFKLYELENDEIESLVNNLIGIKTKLKKCNKCGFLSENDLCDICLDKNRSSKKIIVVSYVQDVIAIEKTQSYDGQYHILNGNLSSSKGIMPKDLNIETLFSRIKEGVEEIILAISPTLDGEITAKYLSSILKNENVKVTRIASGLPMGANLDYADELTIIKALNNRQDI